MNSLISRSISLVPGSRVDGWTLTFRSVLQQQDVEPRALLLRVEDRRQDLVGARPEGLVHVRVRVIVHQERHRDDGGVRVRLQTLAQRAPLGRCAVAVHQHHRGEGSQGHLLDLRGVTDRDRRESLPGDPCRYQLRHRSGRGRIEDDRGPRPHRY